MRIVIAFAIPALFSLSTPALAAWTPAGDTLCTGPSPYASHRMDLFPDGSGGILAGTHIYPYYEQNVYSSRVGSDGTIASTTLIGQAQSTVPDGQGGVYLDGFLPGEIALNHVLPQGGSDPDFPYGGLTVYDTGSGLGGIAGESTASDDSGGAYAAAVLTPAGVNGVRLVVWRILGDATNAPGWPSDGFVVRDAADYLIDPSVTAIPDGANGLVTGIMLETVSGIYWMRAYRLTSTGAQTWTRAATTEHGAGGPVLGLLRSGDHLFYCWGRDSTDGSREIRLQSLAMTDGTTTPGWPAQGVAITRTNPDSLHVRLLDDGFGGVYMVWNRGAVLRAVRVTSAGALAAGWPPEGLSLLDSSAVFVPNQYASFYAYAVAASPAGLITCWSDDRLPGVTLARARWLLPDGTADPAQPDTGRIVAPGTKAIVIGAMSDGNRGVYVGWYDWNPPQDYATNYYILSWAAYAGPLAVPPAGAPVATSLTVWPNPARDVLSVRFAPLDSSPARVELIDVAGHRVRTLESSGAMGRFERLDGLPSGVYFVWVTRAGITRTARVAVVH